MVLYIFWIQVLYQIHVLQIIFFLSGLLFSFLLCLYQVCAFIIFCLVFVEDNAYCIKWFEKYSVTVQLSQRVYIELYIMFSLNLWQNLPMKLSGAGVFLKGKVFNYNFFSRYRVFQGFAFLLSFNGLYPSRNLSISSNLSSLLA